MRLPLRKRTLRQRFFERLDTLGERIGEAIEQLSDEAADRAADLRWRASDFIADARDIIAERAGALRDDASAHLEEVRNAVGGQAATLRAGAYGHLDDAHDVVVQRAKPARRQLSTMRDRVADQAGRVRARAVAALADAGKGARELVVDLRDRAATYAEDLQEFAEDRPILVIEHADGRTEARSMHPVTDLARASWGARPSRALVAGGVAGGVLGALAGGLAAASRLGLHTPAVHATLEAEPKIYQWRGWRVAYYEHGSGQPLVLIHSLNAAASAYEMRAPFARHRDGYRVVALDLLGFGASDRPEVEYTASLYSDLIADFLRDVVAEPAHVVASSLSAAHTVMAASYHPALFKSLLLVNPTGVLSLASPQSAGGRVLQSVFQAPVLGLGLFNLLVSRPGLRYFLRKVYSDTSFIEERMLEQNYQTSHQPNANLAPAAFVGGALNRDISAALPRLEPRSMALWGGSYRQQDVGAEREAFARCSPSLHMETFDEIGGLPHDEARERFERLLCDWLARDEPASDGEPASLIEQLSTGGDGPTPAEQEITPPLPSAFETPADRERHAGE